MVSEEEPGSRWIARKPVEAASSARRGFGLAHRADGPLARERVAVDSVPFNQVTRSPS